ncbi:DEAD/DEAH box helicase [Ancylobacter sp. 6x-1]|uniref:DEAD/DEAH box helicase n=1 Tax=Ancylobacter crimeensis TaxID=2579147 RepID=A0ABT0DBK3_9HYPH|nr:DEAD/DEAH box helicase [Ancylobacter crimeensis]MCK0197340.1 DEAD/DEAH box helicase [Ancylobacter crimeensis]
MHLNSFAELGLAEPILKALAEASHETPTPIQAQAVPHVLAGHDLIGIAQTGTGKTAAFALPILHHIATERRRPERRSARVLVLSPTRELSGQILDSFRLYGRHVRPTTALAIGGVPLGRQARAMMAGVDVLVATPGRLVDLVENNAVRLDLVEMFVLDEADQMLDMGFIHAIRAIVAKLPKVRRNLFFSATMPKEIEKLASALLTDPVRVAVTPVAKTADKIEQKVIFTDRNGKPNLLAEVLSDATIDRALVFSRTKHGADRVVKGLASAGIGAEAIHGNKSQPQRERALAAFRDGKVRVLVATDIAARGIDVPGVSHVVNFDLPNIPESYVHRIGRTARAGREGIAISFCDGEERAYLRDIERLIRLQIPSEDRRTDRREDAGEPRGDGRGEGRNQRRDGSRPGGRPGPRNGEAGNRFRSGPRQGDGENGARSPRGERPQGERHGERGHGERNHGERSHGERSHGDRPHAERQPRQDGHARGDHPRGERHERGGDFAGVRFMKPRGERPAGKGGDAPRRDGTHAGRRPAR